MGQCVSKPATYIQSSRSGSEQQDADPDRAARAKDSQTQPGGPGKSPNPRLGPKDVTSLLRLMHEPGDTPCTHLQSLATQLAAVLGVDMASFVACVGGSACYVTLAAVGQGSDLLPRTGAMRGLDWSPFLVSSGASCVVRAVATSPKQPLPKDWSLLAGQGGLRSFCAAAIAGGGEGQELLGALLLGCTRQEAFREEQEWEATLTMLMVGMGPLLAHPLTSTTATLLASLDAAPTPTDLILRLLAGTGQLLQEVLPPGVGGVSGEWQGAPLQLGVRLALLDEAELELEQALIWEMSSSAAPAAGGPGVQPGEQEGSGSGVASALLSITPVPLAGSLLQEAVRLKKARFIKDVPRYLQSSLDPAGDIFLGGPTPVASIVMLPLLRRVGPLGGLSITSSCPTDFEELRGALRHLVATLGPLLNQRLGGQLAALAAAAKQQQQQQKAAGQLHQAAAGGPSAKLLRVSADQAALPFSSSTSATASRSSSLQLQVGAPGGGRVRSKLLAKRPSHSALLELMKDEVTRATAAAAAEAAGAGGWLADLELTGVVGRGGFGTVYKGTWRGAPAAIKVLHGRPGERAAVKGALEMAVTGAVSHPNIIALYAALPDMVEDAGTSLDLARLVSSGRLSSISSSSSSSAAAGGSGSSRGRGSYHLSSLVGGSSPCDSLIARSGSQPPTSTLLGVRRSQRPPRAPSVAPSRAGSSWAGGRATPLPLRYRPLQPGEAVGTEVFPCCLMVMELCDGGSLRQALKRGLCHANLQEEGGGRRLVVDMWVLLQVLLQLAHALAHLHSLRLLHCDVKPDNVLLKGDANQPLGWCVKLSDFGLSKMMRGGSFVINRSGSGTLTHLAPELFKLGTKLTPAVDAYSFGILMWEAYNARTAYQDINHSALAAHITKAGGRPQWPPGVPVPYQQLATACWAPDPEQRPAMEQVITQLQQLLELVEAGQVAATRRQHSNSSSSSSSRGGAASPQGPEGSVFEVAAPEADGQLLSATRAPRSLPELLSVKKAAASAPAGYTPLSVPRLLNWRRWMEFAAEDKATSC